MAVTVAVDSLLALAVAATWFATLAFVRLRTPLERLHAVAYANILGGGLVTAAALCADGLGPRAIKCVFIWLVTVGGGALMTMALGRAIHLRGGERL